MSSYNMISWLWITMSVLITNPCIVSGDPRHRAGRRSRSCEARNVDNPCLNGGRCHVTLLAGEAADPALVTCRCPPAWTGATCELERDPCADGGAVCGPGWSCVRNSSNTAAGYDCGCGGRAGWRRLRAGLPRCVDVDECALLVPACFNGGRCHNRAGTYHCVCKPGFEGRRCGRSDGSDGWTGWGLWSACSSRCGPGSRSRSRSRLCPDCRPREQQLRRPCRGPCWTGRPRPYTEPPPTARPRHRGPADRQAGLRRLVERQTMSRRTRGRVKRDALQSQDGTAEAPNLGGSQLSDQNRVRRTKHKRHKKYSPAESAKESPSQTESDQPAAPSPAGGAESSRPATEDEDEAAVLALEADRRRVDTELSAFEHAADKMATFARDLASRAAATAGRLSHQHESLLRNITNSSGVQEARRRAEAARQAAAAARLSAANETSRLEQLRRQDGRVRGALRAAEQAGEGWRRLEAERRQAADRAEHQLPREQAHSREVALPSQTADRERSEERERLQASLRRLESLLRRQRTVTDRLRRRAAAAARRDRRERRRSARLVERRRQLLLEQAAARRTYTEQNERRLAAARQRAHQALLRADASVGEQQEVLGRAAAAATQPPGQRWRPPPLPPPPPGLLRLKVLLPDPKEQEARKQAEEWLKIKL